MKATKKRAKRRILITEKLRVENQVWIELANMDLGSDEDKLSMRASRFGDGLVGARKVSGFIRTNLDTDALVFSRSTLTQGQLSDLWVSSLTATSAGVLVPNSVLVYDEGHEIDVWLARAVSTFMRWWQAKDHRIRVCGWTKLRKHGGGTCDKIFIVGVNRKFCDGCREIAKNKVRDDLRRKKKLQDTQ